MKSSLRLLSALAFSAALSLTASATTLTFGDQYSIGSIEPGKPDSDAAQVPLINKLIDLNTGNNQVVNMVFQGSQGDYTFDRLANFDSLVGNVTDVGSSKFENLVNSTFDVTGFTFLLAKYGNGVPGTADSTAFYVWDVTGLTSATIQFSALSHVSLYNPTTTNVPDGGTTAVLLGFALVGMSFIARRKIAA